MSEHALAVLDFPRALELVAGHATSEVGREAVRSLRPRSDRGWLELELERVTETAAFLEIQSPWAPPAIPDCSEALIRLGIDGAVLTGVELHVIGVLLASAGELATLLSGHREDFGHLGLLGERLLIDRALGRSCRQDRRCVGRRARYGQQRAQADSRPPPNHTREDRAQA